MKNGKRIVSLLLVVLMCLGALVGCSGKSSKKGDGTLTIGVPQDVTIPDYDTNAFSVWLEEQSGVDIEWVFFASGTADYKQQLMNQMKHH